MSLSDKIIKYIEDNLKDISPNTVKIYKEKFKGLKDADIIEYFKHAKVRLYVEDKDVTPDKVDKLVERLDVIPQEQLILPYKGNTRSKSEVMIFPVQIRRLQQLATKKSNSNHDVGERNRVGQASGDSKTGKITDNEVNQLVSLGMDRVLTELMSPRSDNLNGKKIMNDAISRDFTFSLNDIPDRVEDKATLQYIDALYKSINLATDLIDNIDDIS